MHCKLSMNRVMSYRKIKWSIYLHLLQNVTNNLVLLSSQNIFIMIPNFIFSIKYNKTSRSYATNTRKSTGLTPSCEQWWSGFCKARWFYSWCRFKHCKQNLKFRFRKTRSTANRASRVFIQTWNQIWSNYKTLCIARQVYKLIT